MQTNEEIMEMLNKTAEALRKNNMQAFVAQDCRQAVNLVKDLMPEGDTISCGGSVSLEQSGVMELMKSGSYNFLDRSKCETREETEELYRRAFFCDTYLTSANAVTMNGELYNVDGNSNRVAAIAYGPKSVIFIVGCNKVVKDLDEAVLRVKKTAAPQNTVRLALDTPCSKTGECLKCMNGSSTASGCLNEKRICCSYLVSSYQRHKNRYKVILVAQPLGY